MAFALIGVDIVLRIVLVERKVAERWRTAGDDEKPSQGTQSVLVEEGAEKMENSVPGPARQEEPRSLESATSAVVQPSSSKTQPSTTTNPHPDPTQHSKPPRRKPFRDRLPPILSLLTLPRTLTTILLTSVAALLYTSFDVVLPLYSSTLFHFSSLGAGLLFLPLLIPAFSAPLVGWASDRYGSRWFVVVGFLVGAPGMVLLRLVDRDSLGMKVLLCVLLAWVGLALDLILTPMIAEFAACVVDDQERRDLYNRSSPISSSPSSPSSPPGHGVQEEKQYDLENGGNTRQGIASSSSLPPPHRESSPLPNQGNVPLANPSQQSPSSPPSPPSPPSTSPTPSPNPQPPNAYAQAYGLFTSAYALGMLLGPLWAGNVAQQAGWGTMSLSLGILSGVCALPAGIWVGGEGGWFTRRVVRRKSIGRGKGRRRT